MIRFVYYAIFTTLLLSGCSAAYLTVVDQELPPRVPEVLQMHHLTLLDRARESNVGLRLQSGVIVSQGNKAFLDACSRKMEAPCSVHTKGLRDSNAGRPAARLNASEVREYAGQSEGLFALEQFFIQETRTYTTYQKHQLG
ncbi:MAG: hypothetical protein R2795_20735 [Saprospiraceae bacterium]